MRLRREIWQYAVDDSCVLAGVIPESSHGRRVPVSGTGSRIKQGGSGRVSTQQVPKNVILGAVVCGMEERALWHFQGRILVIHYWYDHNERMDG